MQMDLHGFPDPNEDHLPWREFLVMFVTFSNRRVTHLRDHDARDDFGTIRKHHVMFYERGESSN
jgi:hypothetical protein